MSLIYSTRRRRYTPYSTPSDGHMQRTLLPASNFVRALFFWDNVPAGSHKACRTADATHGYIAASCVQSLLGVVEAASAAGLWVVVTARAEYAAGQLPDGPNVFNNATLRAQYLAMWAFVAGQLADVQHVAAYEIMSEPRVKTVADAVVAAFMADGCKAVRAAVSCGVQQQPRDTAFFGWVVGWWQVHQVDPATPCMVGPAPYYKPWKLSSTYVLDDPNVIYTAGVRWL